MPHTWRRPVRIAALVTVLTITVIAGWEAFGPPGAPSARGAGECTMSVMPPTARFRRRPPLVGAWEERGDSDLTLDLAADGAAALELKIAGSIAWSEQGTFRMTDHDATVTWLFDRDDVDDFGGDSGQQTFDFRHGLLLLPANGDVFVREG
jgi:hypothetical protein